VFSFSLPTIKLATGAASDPGMLVVGLAEAQDGDLLVGLSEDLAKATTKALGTDVRSLAKTFGASSKTGTCALLALPGGIRLVVVGVGPIDVTAEQVRRAAGAAVRMIAGLPADKPHQVTLSLDTTEPSIIKGAAEGALLGSYHYGPTKTETPGIGAITVVSTSRKPDAKQALDLAQVTAEAVLQARDWVNTPANLLYPETFVESARAVTKGSKVAIDVWDDKALERDGFGGILAVGGGSSRKPRLLKVAYAPRGARFHLVLVGKGITFDAGGLDLKTQDGMYTMKCDMAGAASVIAAVNAIAKLGLRIQVTAWAALAENLPSGTAYRPSDVLTMFNGATVENGNTDAEGRLVLADALAKASSEKPDLVVDVATLTGACMVALGTQVAGLMARDDETADMVLDAAEAAGELFWQLPITDDAAPKLASKVADVKSTGDRYGGALTAAAFLSTFVPEDTPWAHLDIAGPAFNDAAEHGYVTTGGTGMSVRTLIALAHARAN
jgi:leucyl aminopeptidase